MRKLTHAEIRRKLHYDAENGIFNWKISNGNWSKQGDEAGCKNANGYIVIGINGGSYGAHRLAFLYMRGYLPENDIDHINRNRSDNRWCNLREVSHQCNIRNSKINSNNTSGITGVSRYREDKWQVHIRIGNKLKFIGHFDDLTEAVAHRLAAEQCLDWNGCDSSSPAFKYIRRCLK